MSLNHNTWFKSLSKRQCSKQMVKSDMTAKHREQQWRELIPARAKQRFPFHLANTRASLGTSRSK